MTLMIVIEIEDGSIELSNDFIRRAIAKKDSAAADRLRYIADGAEIEMDDGNMIAFELEGNPGNRANEIITEFIAIINNDNLISSEYGFCDIDNMYFSTWKIHKNFIENQHRNEKCT